MTDKHKVPRVVWQGFIDDIDHRVTVSVEFGLLVEFFSRYGMDVEGWFDTDTSDPDYAVAIEKAIRQLPEFTPPPNKDTP